MGTAEEWEEATEALRTTALAMGLELVIDEGGGAFYGPKISVQAHDAIGRTHQMSTIQLTSRPPSDSRLEYIGADNGRHRPIMIHRALFGSVERFFAILLEHYAGALPTWLSPEQVRVLGVRDDHEEYAHKVADRLRGRRGPGRGRSGRRTARRPDPAGQAAQDPLHPGGRGRRCGGRHGRGQPPGERPARAGGGAHRLHRDARARDRRAAAPRSHAVTSSTCGPDGGASTSPRSGRPDRRGADAAATGRPRRSSRRPGPVCVLPDRGQRPAVGRQRRPVAGRAAPSPCSTPTPTPAAT